MHGKKDVDKRMLLVCQLIQAIPLKIKRFVLKRYQYQMQKLSWIYFFHRRKIEREHVCDHREIAMQIYKIQSWMKYDLTLMKESDLLTPEALAKSQMTDADLKEYGLLESTESVKH